MTIKTSITVTSGPDWGCEHTEADSARWIGRLIVALDTAFPGCDIDVIEGGSGGTRINIVGDCGPDESAVDAVVQQQWELFCANNFDEVSKQNFVKGYV